MRPGVRARGHLASRSASDGGRSVETYTGTDATGRHDGRAVFDRKPARIVAGLSAALPALSAIVPLASVATALFLPIRSRTPWSQWHRLLIATATLSALMMVVSGLMADSGPQWPQILSAVVFGLCVIGFSKVASDVSTTAQILAVAGLGTTAYFAVVGRNESHELTVLWKYGVALPFTIAVVYLACRFGRRLTPIFTLGAIAFVSLVLEYRSFSGICLAAVVAWLFHSRAGTSRWWVLRAGFLGALLAVVFNVIINVIESGVFGISLQQKTQNQLDGGGPAILSGRVEPPLSVAAISEKPLVGWGNPQEIGEQTLSLGGRFANAIGMYDIPAYRQIWIRSDGQISLHSILFESWVSGGVLAAIFPLALIALFAVALFKARGRFYPLIAVVCVQGVWDVLFSPWAVNRSALMALGALLAIFAITQQGRASSTADALASAPQAYLRTTVDRPSSTAL
jgi:hypothetical protein